MEVRRARRVVVALVVAAVLAGAGPAAAHGAGALSELPLPRWQFAWAVAAGVVIAFFVVGTTWRQPRLGALAEGRSLPAWTVPVTRGGAVALRLLGLVLAVVVVTAGLFGNPFPAANIAPIGILVAFWVGLPVLSMLLGDVWRLLSPFETVAAVVDRVRGRTGPAEPAPEATHWPAVVGVAGFVWFALAYHSPTTPELLGWVALAYAAAVLTATLRWGRAWLRTGEGFGVLFGLFGALGPFAAGDDGRLRLRWPVTGLGRITARPGTLVLLSVVLGATVFEGMTRTTFWFDLTIERVGWGYTVVATLGLVWTVGLVAFLYLGATRFVAAVVGEGEDGDRLAARYAPVLVPVAASYLVAHYLTALVVDLQGFWFLLSDPYGEGWDLLGTAGGTVDVEVLSTSATAWIQAVALALGHAAAMVVAHDVAVATHEPRAALRAQYVLLALLTGSAVAGVVLLLGS